MMILHIYLPMKMEQSVSKLWHVKYRRRGIIFRYFGFHNIEKYFKYTLAYAMCFNALYVTL